MIPDEFADVVRRDTALPGLRLALDPAALGELLSARVPGWSVDGLHLAYLRYKPGASLVAAIAWDTPTGRRFAAVKTFSRASAPKLAKIRRSGVGDDVGWGAVIDEERHVAVHDISSDRWLPGVRAVMAGTCGPMDVLRYKPERRLVGRIDDVEGIHLVKVHRPGAAARTLRAQRRFATAGLPVADVLDADPGRGIVHYRWLSGVTTDVSCGDGESGDPAAVGALLAAVHRVEPGVGFARADPRSDLVDSVHGIAAAVPELADEARSVAKTVLDQWSARRGHIRVTHGDFSADQVVTLDNAAPTPIASRFGRLGLLDLDRACLADPMSDVASWIAAEMVDGRTELDADPVDVAGGLLSGYLPEHPGSAKSDRLERLYPLTSAALLQRAVTPFRHAEPGWPARMAELVTAARRLAEPASVVTQRGSG